MGWCNQHDIKVKKVWKAVALGAAVLSFFSCEMDPTKGKLNDYTVIEGKNEKTVNVWNKGDVFLADYNLDYKYLPFNIIPKPEDIKKRRDAEDFINRQTFTQFNKEADNFTSILDKRNEKLLLTIKNVTKARAVYVPIECEVNTITATLGDKKDFYSYYDYALEKPVKKEAECKYVGKNCIVWNIPVAQPGFVELKDEDFVKIGEKFDHIYDVETAFIGTHKYTQKCDNDLINANDKIEIIMTDICGDAVAEDGGSGYIGYFSSADIIKKELHDENGDVMKNSDGTLYNFASNETQCIFIDSPYYTKYENDSYSTLVHEFQHLLNFCYKQQFGVFSDRWFTEMMSMLTEDAFSNYLNLSDEERPQTRLINWEMAYGYIESPFIWYDLSQYDLIGRSYSATYAFGAYIARNYGGLELIHEMATNKTTDYYAVIEALEKLGYVYDEEDNFSEIVKNYGYVLINTDENTDEDITTINKTDCDQYHTLNRKCTSSAFPELSLDAIKLKQDFEYTDMKGKKQIMKIEPVYLNPNKSYPASEYSLYYCGVALWKVGTNIKKFNIEVADDPLVYWKVLYPEGQ